MIKTPKTMELAKARGNVSLRHRLDDADENAADKGAGDGADAAENGSVEEP